MAFPDLTLATPYVAQEAYKASLVKVLKIDDDTEGKSLRVFVQLGDNPSFKYWIPVQSGDAYSVNWTNHDVSVAITEYFKNE